MNNKREWIAFGKYVIAGATSVIIQFGILKLLVEVLHLNATLSSTIAYALASVALYLMLYYWAFKSNGDHKVMASKYVLTTSLMLGVNFLIFWIMTQPLGIWYIYSQIIASTVIALLNYVVNRLFTFK